MKQFTKKFLSKGVKSKKPTKGAVEYNAKRAEKILKMPKELYLELSSEFPYSKLCTDLGAKKGAISIFMSGFLCGWAEGNNKIKK